MSKKTVPWSVSAGPASISISSLRRREFCYVDTVKMESSRFSTTVTLPHLQYKHSKHQTLHRWNNNAIVTVVTSTTNHGQRSVHSDSSTAAHVTKAINVAARGRFPIIPLNAAIGVFVVRQRPCDVIMYPTALRH